MNSPVNTRPPVVFRIAPSAAHDAHDEGQERRRERTAASQVERLFRQAYRSIAGAFAVALLGWGVFALLTDEPRVLWWSAAMHSVQGLQLLLAWRFRRQGRAALAEPQQWLRRYLVVLALSSTVWGAAAWWLLPSTNWTATSWLVGVLLAVAAAGAHLATPYRPAIYCWLLPVLLPLVAVLLHEGLPLSLTLGSLVAVSGLVIGVFALSRHRLLMRELQTKLDNDALVRALRQQVFLVERANREKSRFLASASHDLRQPMHALGLFAATLQKQLGSSPLQPMVTNMIRSIDALEQSFTSMLDISKLDAGVIEPNLQSFPIRDLFRVLHMHCSGQAEELGLSLRFKPGGKIVTSDPHLLERVLSNLIHNAIRYTNEGGLVVVARNRRQHVSIEVWDTGIGMAEDELPKVFDEFYQVGNPGRDRTRGLGMGLAIVKRLVVLMGHRLEVASTPGRGTVFRILIKQTELVEMDNMVIAADTVPAEVDANRTVLLIDDEEIIREGMRELLQTWGYHVLTAGTILEACTEVRRHAGVIDVVVSDLRLANDEDGIAAIERVREFYGAPLPALLITGDTSPEQVKRVHDSGHQVLFKPVRTRELYAVLRAVP
ncbi:ATP-binding protein [Rhizobacter sp. SG703]|uniref:hybrid sensor histidine kinase/response regulator n=1 Tax=Rhizobacter sp. SG703 TaxID=2587140 RepID=UPI001448708B|nr:ATP-binding protein [Rhizobacter sp. SG703]NKI92816.1 signal transduction histidine kinase/CheY-like chemotaxis protein [Rhizobacter sp. SG703]